MSILGIVGSAAGWGLTAYQAYSALHAGRGATTGSTRMSASGGGFGERAAIGGVAGLAGYLGGRSGMRAGRRRHSKGITGSQLKGFNKVCRLLNKVGMVPRALHHVKKAKGKY